MLKNICIYLFLCFTSSTLIAAEVDEIWYALYIGDQKVGHAYNRREIKNGQVHTIDSSHFSMMRGDMQASLKVSELSIETLDGKPIAFELDQDMGFSSVQSRGKMNDKNEMVVTIKTGGITQTKIIPFTENTVMVEGMLQKAKETTLKEGLKLNVDFFTPNLMQTVSSKVIVRSKESVDLLGQSKELTRVDINMYFPSGIYKSSNYLDDNYKPLKMTISQMGMNFNLIACEKEIALSPNSSKEILGKFFIKSPKEIKNINDIKSIAYKLQLTDDRPWQIHQDNNQKILGQRDQQIMLQVSPTMLSKGQSIPYKGNNPEALKALKPSRFIQSDHAKVRQLAQKVIGNTKDAGEAAKKIESFVFNYIEKIDLSVVFATASDIIEHPQGDCSESAVLTAALCQAVGIPSRVAVGYVYATEFLGHENIFGGHVWTQVFINDQWIGLDATGILGSYTPAHITISTGDGAPEDFIGMGINGGRFEIKDIQIRK